jgi:polysaccharide export outer membrane protein
MASMVQNQAETTKRQQQFLSQLAKVTLADYRDYKVGPEDLLVIEFFGQEDLNRETRVNGRGEISLPLIGAIAVSGQSPAEIETQLVKAYKTGRFIKEPQLSVSVKEYRHQRVMVTGAVANPGSYEVIGPRTLLEMLGKAGGIIDKPEMKAGDLVYVSRAQNAPDLRKPAPRKTEPTPQETNIVIDLRRLLSGDGMQLNIPIKNGDVIYVPPAQMAFVLGAVKKPGQVPVRHNLTVTQAVAMTEGQDLILSSNRITILRFGEQGERLTIPVDLKGITSGNDPDPLLKPNDIVFVHEHGIRRFFYDIRNLLPGSMGMSGAAF